MALKGLSTRTVLTAEKLTFCRLSEYSNILQHMKGERKEFEWCNNKPNTLIAITALSDAKLALGAGTQKCEGNIM